MADYIDREKLLDDLSAAVDHRGMGEIIAQTLTRYVKRQPPADVAPVVHGRWEFLGPNRLIKGCLCGTCSACKVRSKYIETPALCPNCGAKMDGGDLDGR
jgi:hypothetical protein